MLLSPPKDLPQELPLFEGADKVVHVAIFPRQAFWLCFTLLLLYGIATELAQEYMHMGRSGDPLDLLADALGISLGYWVKTQLAHKLLKK